MSRDSGYEAELTGSREAVATVLSGVVDGILAGSLRLGDGPDAVRVDAPAELSLEIELEVDDDEVDLELEVEWPRSPGDGPALSGADSDSGGIDPRTPDDEGTPEDGTAVVDGHHASPGADPGPSDDEPSTIVDRSAPALPVGAADESASLARFELFRDRGGEWRWRLRHRNGNVIATSGEGYTRKHNARKGLESVVRNAPGADVTEGSPP